MEEIGDAFQQVSTENFGSRIKDSCGGICIGVLLFFGAFPLLFWNEGRAVERYDTLQEGKDITTDLASVGSINSTYDGKLIHFVTVISSDGTTNLTDPIFGVSTEDLKLKRSAEMFQWVETETTKTKKNTGGKSTTTTTYTYKAEWASGLISSSNFNSRNGHENPSTERFQDFALSQDPIYAGAFELPSDIVSSKIGWWTPVDGLNKYEILDNAISISTEVHDWDSGFYIGKKTVQSPNVGDSRVTFASVKPAVISVIAQQSGSTFKTYEADAGGSLLLFKQGNFTSAQMFEQAEAENATMTWLLRLVGYLVMAGGIYLVLRPIEVFMDVIPILGTVVGWGLIFIALVVAGFLAGFTIAIAWLIHHPLIGGLILLGVLVFVGGIAFLFKHFESKKKEENSNNVNNNNDDKIDVEAGGIDEVEVVPMPPPTDKPGMDDEIEVEAEEEIPVVVAEPYVPKY